MSRLSCSLCVLASRADLVRAAQLRPALAATYAELEREIGHRFRADLSMNQIIEKAERSDPGQFQDPRRNQHGNQAVARAPRVSCYLA